MKFNSHHNGRSPQGDVVGTLRLWRGVILEPNEDMDIAPSCLAVRAANGAIYAVHYSNFTRIGVHVINGRRISPAPASTWADRCHECGRLSDSDICPECA